MPNVAAIEAAAAAAATAAANAAASVTDMQRALGRIEGTQAQLLGELRAARDALHQHQTADLQSMEILAKSIVKQRDDVLAGFAGQDEKRAEMFKELRGDIEPITNAQSFARGAGWVIIGLVTFLGGSLVAALIALYKGH